jgi:hypothetical protein
MLVVVRIGRIVSPFGCPRTSGSRTVPPRGCLLRRGGPEHAKDRWTGVVSLPTNVCVPKSTGTLVARPDRVPAAHACGSLRFRLLPTDVGGLAPGIDAGRASDRLVLLADALFDGGSGDEQVIGYCRSEGPHILRCRVVDRAVGKS